MTESKPWYKSTAKVGSLLLALASILYVVGTYLTTGEINFEELQKGLSGVGIALGIYGVRARQDRK